MKVITVLCLVGKVKVVQGINLLENTLSLVVIEIFSERNGKLDFFPCCIKSVFIFVCIDAWHCSGH